MYPMPVAGLIDHPDFIAFGSAARGMIVTLLLFYWQSECKPLPKGNADLFAICRAWPVTWHKHREEILKVFNDIKPELDRYFAERKAKKTTLEIVSARARANRRNLRLVENAPPVLAAEDAIPAISAVPYQRVATPEERGPRAKVAPSKRG
jgi:hypothetical protein